MPTVTLIGASGLQRGGLRHLLAEEGFTVVAEATSAQALPGASADVIVYDATGAPRVGDDVRALRALHPDSRVVLLADAISASLLRGALEAGADGCLSADTSSRALAEWLHFTLAGGKAFPRDLASILAQGMAPSETKQAAGRPLSAREKDILHGLLCGRSNKRIANDLGITEATVKVHLKTLLRKINVANRTQAAIWAMNNGIAVPAQIAPAVG